MLGVLRAAAYLAFAGAALDLDLSHTSFTGLALILVATGLALSGIGVLMGAVVLVFKQGEALSAIVTFGFGLLSGALFPRTLLPGWVQTLGNLLPTRFALDGMRHALFGGREWQGDFGALLITTIILLPASIAVFGWTVKMVKRAGSLSQY